MVLPASETRKKAREALQGNWGKVALITLIYLAIFFVTGLLSTIPFLGLLIAIGEYVIMIPLAYGMGITILKIKRGQEVGYVDFITDGFKNFARSWCVTGRILLKMLVPIILYVIGLIIILASAMTSVIGAFGSSTTITGISLFFMIIAFVLVIVAAVFFVILELKYGLSTYIAIDNPNMKAKDCVEKSGTLMEGNSGKLFCLGLSFIGWILLAILVAIIPFIGFIAAIAAEVFLLPYILMALVVFYENIAEISTTQTVETSGNVENAEPTKENTIQEKSGSQDVKAEIVDIPELEKKPDNENN